jgi:hypothetical protein
MSQSLPTSNDFFFIRVQTATSMPEYSFDVLLAVRAIVRNGACREIDLVANHPCLPGGGKKFRKRALPGLVGAQRDDEGSTVECGPSTVPFATDPCSVRYKL